MKAWDYEAVAYDCAVYCIECLPDGLTANDEDVAPIFASEEWDYYPVCDVCGTEHDYVTLIGDDDQ